VVCFFRLVTSAGWPCRPHGLELHPVSVSVQPPPCSSTWRSPCCSTTTVALATPFLRRFVGLEPRLPTSIHTGKDDHRTPAHRLAGWWATASVHVRQTLSGVRPPRIGQCDRVFISTCMSHRKPTTWLADRLRMRARTTAVSLLSTLDFFESRCSGRCPSSNLASDTVSGWRGVRISLEAGENELEHDLVHRG